MSSNNDTTIEIIDLYPQEMELIKALRNVWRFGDVTIKMKDGIPYRLVRTMEFIELNPNAGFNVTPSEKPLQVRKLTKKE